MTLGNPGKYEMWLVNILGDDKRFTAKAFRIDTPEIILLNITGLLLATGEIIFAIIVRNQVLPDLG